MKIHHTETPGKEYWSISVHPTTKVLTIALVVLFSLPDLLDCLLFEFSGFIFPQSSATRINQTHKVWKCLVGSEDKESLTCTSKCQAKLLNPCLVADVIKWFLQVNCASKCCSHSSIYQNTSNVSTQATSEWYIMYNKDCISYGLLIQSCVTSSLHLRYREQNHPLNYTHGPL